jgi:hypothetical protein
MAELRRAGNNLTYGFTPATHNLSGVMEGAGFFLVLFLLFILILPVSCPVPVHINRHEDLSYIPIIGMKRGHLPLPSGFQWYPR